MYAPIFHPKTAKSKEPMAATVTLFAPIAKQRVTADNPATAGNDLDADRCAALHNTLLLYGWVCSGKKIFQMEKRSWWGKHGSDDLKRILRPTVVRFLSKVFDVPGHNFFYHVPGLATAKEMLQVSEMIEDGKANDPQLHERHRFLVIYASSKALVTNPAGVVYDQQTGKALLMPTYNHIYNLRKDDLPWQSLETILSAWIDMVEAEKAVAIHDGVSSDDPHADIAEAPKTKVGIAKSRMQFNTRPWILQPYTLKDLHACLDTWKALVEKLEKKAGITVKRPDPADEDYDPDDEAPLASRTALNIAGIPRGFAYELLSHAQYSPIWFIAPGIRLPKVEEFLQQPFKNIAERYPEETRGMKMPFLFLRCPGTVSAKDAKFRYPFSTLESVPCGLYLDAFPNAANPFEDACRLVLPIKLGSNKYARTSDFRPIRKSHSDLYQIEVNPFVMRHGPKLVAVLENWLENVEAGHWTVNEKGVQGGIGQWRQADTREDWWRYQSKHLFI
ncbi:hypothetical protein Tdes44962_MAKER07787 [Teratosphaeria destructans]|uniref:Uncharacterized protein n=1 Tax=Teratosphaeria destructans TaxID=418781 RepID=A0A9W7SYC1_9PEZI|nr:hypothetical protein Tdes44962_MAKER07787 [Teratosphaeria destructans]